MIGSIKGVVINKTSEYGIIETSGGVGYRVFMPLPQLNDLTVGKEVRVCTHTAVREDAILLYGFMNQEYYDLFIILIGVSGVGAKVAQGILSAIKPDAFYVAVQSRDLAVLTKLPGIGKKTAERLLLELKDKVGGIGSGDSSAFISSDDGGSESAVGEAVAALNALGYSNSEILPALKKIPNYESLESEEIIKKVLKAFAGRK